MARKKKTKAEQIADIPIEIISRLKGESGMSKLRGYVTALQAGYKRRVGQFKRHGLTSYAQISLEDSMSKVVKNRKIKDMTRNQLLMEFARYSKFFHDKTSTVEGIKELNLEQDKRIFGVDQNGKPLFRMTDAERKRYWEAYDEFIHQNLDLVTAFGSDRIQTAIAEAISESSNVLNFTDMLDRVAKKLRNEDPKGWKYGPNVYSGRGPTFQ